MTETAPASATEKKKAAKPKRIRRGPSVRDLIVKALSASERRSGVSLPALKKALAADGYDVEKNNSRIKLSITSLVTNDILVQTKGFGICGSFRLNRKQSKTTAKPAAAKKPKAAAAKKPVAKKSPKEVKKPAVFKCAAAHFCSQLDCVGPVSLREIMTETAPATEKKKAAKLKRIRRGPSVRDLIVKALSASERRSGVSLPALKKALAADGYDVEKNNSRIKLSITSLVTNDILVQTKGFGICGSFRLNRKQSKTTAKPAAAKKPKAAAAKETLTKIDHDFIIVTL